MDSLTKVSALARAPWQYAHQPPQGRRQRFQGPQGGHTSTGQPMTPPPPAPRHTVSCRTGLYELTKIAVAKGGNALTCSGLAGVGDLVLTW